jgi:hypothetical protein
VANNGSGDVSVYRINQSNGAITEVAGSPFPAEPDMRFLTVVSPR